MSRQTKPVLSDEDAGRIIEAGTRAAAGAGARVSIAVVDDGGHLLAFRRMDGVHTGTVDVALAKARTASGFRRPGRDLAAALANGQSVLLTLPGCLPLPGSIPVIIDGAVVGAVGVSGASPQIDDEVAEAAASAVAEGGTAP